MRVSNVIKFTCVSAWENVAKIELFCCREGSVLAHVEVTAKDASQEPTPAELTGLVESRAAAGRIGTFEIEPTTIRAARLNKGEWRSIGTD
jgi:hypothetical protein